MPSTTTSSGLSQPNEIVALTLAIVAINGWNRLAISMRAPVGEYVSPRRPDVERVRRPRADTPSEHHQQGVNDAHSTT